MKKLTALLAGLAFLVLLTGCGTSVGSSSAAAFSFYAPAFSFDSGGNYTGFGGLPTSCTQEAAKKNGYAVMRDSKFAANEKAWMDFVKASSAKKNAAVRIAEFYTEEKKGPFFLDVFYRDGSYYLCDSDARTFEKHPFKYLLTLTGKSGIPKRGSKAVVLTDDAKLTFDEVWKYFISSDTRVTDQISPFKLIMFQ